MSILLTGISIYTSNEQDKAWLDLHIPMRWKTSEVFPKALVSSVLYQKENVKNPKVIITSLCSLKDSKENNAQKEKEIVCVFTVETYATTLFSYLVEAFGIPFKVDFISEAKCHERVFDARIPP